MGNSFLVLFMELGEPFVAAGPVGLSTTPPVALLGPLAMMLDNAELDRAVAHAPSAVVILFEADRLARLNLADEHQAALPFDLAFAARVREEAGAAAQVLLADFSEPRKVRVKGFAHEVEVRHAPRPGDTLSGRVHSLHTAGKGTEPRLIDIEGRAP